MGCKQQVLLIFIIFDKCSPHVRNHCHCFELSCLLDCEQPITYVPYHLLHLQQVFFGLLPIPQTALELALLYIPSSTTCYPTSAPCPVGRIITWARSKTMSLLIAAPSFLTFCFPLRNEPKSCVEPELWTACPEIAYWNSLDDSPWHMLIFIKYDQANRL